MFALHLYLTSRLSQLRWAITLSIVVLLPNSLSWVLFSSHPNDPMQLDRKTRVDSHIWCFNTSNVMCILGLPVIFWILCCTCQPTDGLYKSTAQCLLLSVLLLTYRSWMYILDVWIWFAGSLVINKKRSWGTVDIGFLSRVMAPFCTNMACCVSIAKQLLKENIHILTIVKRMMNHVKTLLGLFPCYN